AAGRRGGGGGGGGGCGGRRRGSGRRRARPRRIAEAAVVDTQQEAARVVARAQAQEKQHDVGRQHLALDGQRKLARARVVREHGGADAGQLLAERVAVRQQVQDQRRKHLRGARRQRGHVGDKLHRRI